MKGKVYKRVRAKRDLIEDFVYLGVGDQWNGKPG